MANAVGKKHWYLDTVGSISTAPVCIKSISWVGISGSEIADNDICNIKDAVGGISYFYRMATAGTPELGVSFGGQGLRVDGMYLTTLGHGAVIVTIA